MNFEKMSLCDLRSYAANLQRKMRYCRDAKAHAVLLRELDEVTEVIRGRDDI